MNSNRSNEETGDFQAEALDDEVQDWKNIAISKDGGIVPKRGNKDFAPDGTQTQQSMMQESRDAMFDTLNCQRGHHVRQGLRGVWLPRSRKALILHARGPFFKEMGKAANFGTKIKGMWLEGIETLYLVERGSLQIFLGDDSFEQYLSNADNSEYNVEVLPLLSLSQIYAYVLESVGSGCESDFLHEYQVYSLLKRNGFLVQRFKKIEKDQALIYEQNFIQSKFTKILNSFFCGIINNNFFAKFGMVINTALSRVGLFAYPPFHPLHYYTKHYFNISSVYRALSLIHSYSTFDSLKQPQHSEKCKVTFNVWKPTPNFSKTRLPTPDFHICVLDYEKSSFLQLNDIHFLLNEINYVFPGEPPAFAKNDAARKKIPPMTKRELKLLNQKERQSKLSPETQKSIEYNKLRDQKLKSGPSGRSIILSLVQSGVISFIQLGEGDFALGGPMVDDLNKLAPKTSHGIIRDF